jgi:multidrug efflux pump
MTVGTLFTLFVVPVFYSLIAARHSADAREENADGSHAALQPAREMVEVTP